jgi:hypothetical protein
LVAAFPKITFFSEPLQHKAKKQPNSGAKQEHIQQGVPQ